MNIWARVGQFLQTVTVDAFSSVVEAVRTVFEGDPETRRQVGFSIAMIALSAKMAKADGVVTEDEVEAFKELFAIPPDEANNVARLYNLAKQDVSGYQAYGRQVRNIFPGDKAIYADVLDGLFHIAKADSVLHENEMRFMDDLAVIFELEEFEYQRIKARHVDGDVADPYVMLDAERSWDFDALKKQYRKLAAESHPDRLVARGVPKEFVAIANDRLAAINHAWEQIEAEFLAKSKKAELSQT